MAAMTAMPSDANALAWFPLGHPRANDIHDSDDFMAGDARILQAGPVTFFDE
jgi:hypothetical protein